MEFTAEKIAAFLGGRVEGDSQVTVTTVSKIEEGFAGSLSFLANPKYTPYIYTTKASIVLVNNDFVPEHPISATLVRVPDAYKAIAQLLEFYNQTVEKSGISEKAALHETAKIGEKCFIGDFVSVASNVVIGSNVILYPGVVLSENVEIGNNTTLYSNVSVYKDCKIGSDCIIHSGTVIGSDGFGFAPQENSAYKKIPQAGNVIIENNVEIGANCSIDRATIGSTIIRSGVKLDNLIQVAHNVEIGENTVIAALTGISGSTKIGKFNMIGGQVGFAGHLKITDNVKIGAQSGVHRDVEQKGAILQGSPVTSMHDFYRSSLLFSKLPEMQTRINELERKLQQFLTKNLNPNE